MGEDALGALNDLELPLAQPLSGGPARSSSSRRRSTRSSSPNIDESLDEDGAKRAFWQAFRVLGEWYVGPAAVLAPA